ncbi:MAG: ABC transporter substrate-binding protein [Actinobacteria bacterium]|nr:ABC transporter substrate-binding protein [Actinomycetota bacterium]
MRRTSRKLALLVSACMIALVVVGASSGAHKASKAPKAFKTLVFGTASDPVVLDGALVSDGESLRVIDQIFESLIKLKPGTTKVAPGLATSWKTAGGGKVWTFALRKGVKFHDGTKFNAAAVCYNFNRWYNFKGAFQSPDATYYWQAIFLGFHNNESSDLSPSLFKGCKAKGQYSAQFTLAKPFGPFIPALSLTNFAIASPTALKKYGADKAEIRNGIFTPTGTYGFKHPTGTGPFKFKSWTVGEKLEIDRFAGYWGTKAKLGKVIFRPISNNTARLQALQTGEIMGYDLVAPQDYGAIKGNSKLKLLTRPAFNVAYVTLHQGTGSPMNDLKVRQAVAYGLNRTGLINSSAYPPGAVVAKEFQPPQLFGYAKKGVKTYNFDPAKARTLLNSSSCHVPCKVDFWYPSAVSRPYMPDPKRNFEVFKASLEASGFDVTAHTANWRPDYVGKVTNGTAGDLNLIGWTGDYGDPDNFLGVFFGTFSEQFNFHNNQIFNILQKARTETDQAKRVKLYEQANKIIMNYLPAVPYAHTSPALGFKKTVNGYKPSPVSLEPFALVSIGGV